MGLDLYVGAPWIKKGALMLTVFSLLLLLTLILINLFVPTRLLRGLLSGVAIVTGIYLFSLWLS